MMAECTAVQTGSKCCPCQKRSTCSQRCACKQRKTQCTDCLPAHLGLCKNTGLDDRVESNEEQANKGAPQASTSRPSQSSGKASQGRFGAGSHRDTSGANLLLEVESAADRSKTADDFRAAENLLNNMGEEELRQRLRNILQTQPHMMPFITNSIGPEQTEPVPGALRTRVPCTMDLPLHGAAGDPMIQDTDDALSPNTEKNVKFLLQAVHAKEAHLERDSEGKVQVVYENEKMIPLAHVDQSKSHAIQEGKNHSDVRTKVNVCLEMIEAIKASRAPSGVVINKTKARPNKLGEYREGKEFEKLAEVLGRGSCAGDIVVIKDKELDLEHAIKTVMISEFSTDEVRCWVDLGESDSVPSLYLFRLDGPKVVFHMEKIEHGVTLEKIISEHMYNLWQHQPELVRPFSLCMFYGLLSVVKEMHDKNWTHRDLHSGNVMVKKDTMSMKVLDFGMARKLRQDFEFNHDDLKNDILNAIRLFCGLYIGQDFENNFMLEKEIRAGNLRKRIMESGMSEEDREELLQLIAMTYQVTSDPSQAGYGDTSAVLEDIEGKIFPKKVTDVMRMAAAVLFPDLYSGQPDLDMMGEEVADGAVGGESVDDLEGGEFDLEAAAAAVTDEFIERLRIKFWSA